MKIYKDSKVFVLCPAGAVTGGAELLHQLVDSLNNLNIESYIVYYGDKEPVIPLEYDKYNIKIAQNIEDEKKNVIVLYEVVLHFYKKYSHIQIVFWWLSVDHFYMFNTRVLNIFDIMRWNISFGIVVLLKRLYHLVKGKNYFKNCISIKGLKNVKAINAYQSEYAQFFLNKNRFKQTIALKDFINTEHYQPVDLCKRENIVLYNPKKGLKYTKKIINKIPNVRCIPVEKMTRNELIELMRKSKCYIDFGYHPGKDRLPREAVLNGCCVITGLDGSAKYYEDVPIESHYKYPANNSSIDKIVDQIKYTLDNYDAAYCDFTFYKAQVLREQAEFYSQVSTLFKSDDL